MSLQEILSENHKSINVDLFSYDGKKIHNYQSNILDKTKPHLITDKFYCHSYIPVYDELFSEFKDKEINLLEIGILHGGSLNLWDKYFSRANIYGMELEPIDDWLVNHEKIKVLQTDAYSLQGLTAFNNINYDIIIDDGPHTKETMCYFAKHYIHKLNKNGLLIIEDIPTPDFSKPYNLWIPEILSNIPKNINVAYKIFDLRLKSNRSDDVMLVIKLL